MTADVAEWLEVGDLHFEKLQAYFPHEDADKYQYQALAQVEHYAKKNGVRQVNQLGDIFETPFPKRDTETDFLDFLTKTELKWDFIIGNHDYESTDENALLVCGFITKRLKALDHARFHLNPSIVRRNGVLFNYLPYPHTQPMDSKEPMVCFGHFELAGAVRDNGRVIHDDEGVVLDSPHTFRLGHLHRHQPHYVGTTLQFNFGEPLPKGFAHCWARMEGGKLKVKVKFVPIKTPYEFHNIIITKDSDFDNLVKNYSDRRKLCKIIVKANVPVPKDIWSKVNIYDVDGYRTKAELESLKKGEFYKFDRSIMVDPKAGLTPFLRSKELTESQIRRASHIADIGLRRIWRGEL